MDEKLKELLEQYGYEYLSEKNPGACPYDMDELDELTGYSASEAIRRAFYGYRYNPYWDGEESHREEFNPNDEYFAFNGYANLVSITSWALAQWILDNIDDEDDFIAYCQEQGYIDEIAGVGLISALHPMYDSRKSFGGKALINESPDGSVLSLISYDTTVATYDRQTNELDVFGWFGATTARHIREFAAQLGIDLPAGKDIKGRYRA